MSKKIRDCEHRNKFHSFHNFKTKILNRELKEQMSADPFLLKFKFDGLLRGEGKKLSNRGINYSEQVFSKFLSTLLLFLVSLPCFSSSSLFFASLSLIFPLSFSLTDEKPFSSPVIPPNRSYGSTGSLVLWVEPRGISMEFVVHGSVNDTLKGWKE